MSDSATSLGNANGVERIGVQALPDRPARPRVATPLREVLAAPAPSAVQPEPAPATVYVPQKPSAADLINANFSAIARILAVRLQLLLALIGAFVLAEGAMASQSNAGLLVLIAWAVLTIMPLVFLEYSGRQRR